jgi:hypothetical protein
VDRRRFGLIIELWGGGGICDAVRCLSREYVPTWPPNWTMKIRGYCCLWIKFDRSEGNRAQKVRGHVLLLANVGNDL